MSEGSYIRLVRGACWASLTDYLLPTCMISHTLPIRNIRRSAVSFEVMKDLGIEILDEE